MYFEGLASLVIVAVIVGYYIHTLHQKIEKQRRQMNEVIDFFVTYTDLVREDEALNIACGDTNKINSVVDLLNTVTRLLK